MIKDQTIKPDYALYNGDCIEVMRDMPDNKIDLSIYSPPFCGLYNYSSDDRDLSNNASYPEFFDHYGFVVAELARLTKPGRINAVHVMDVPGSGNGDTAKMGCGANAGTGLIDFPGDVIRLHEKHGFQFMGRAAIRQASHDGQGSSSCPDNRGFHALRCGERRLPVNIPQPGRERRPGGAPYRTAILRWRESRPP